MRSMHEHIPNDRVIWDATGDDGTEVSLSQTPKAPDKWSLEIMDPYGNAGAVQLDKKHMKDLFNAIGNEIGAF